MAVLLAFPPACAAEARLLLVVVDGLDVAEVTDAEMPALARAQRESPWCPSARSLASMPTRTNTNHATLLTGVEPEIHGITGNAVWDRRARRIRKLALAGDLLVETVFTVAHRAGRGLRTAAAVGKPKLGTLFSADRGRQHPPDELWDARTASDAARDHVTGYAYDGTTLAAARSLVEHAGADFLFVNLSDVDRVSHGWGPRSPQAAETRRRTDAALGAFLEWLTGRPDWSATTVLITADHGFDAVSHPPLRFGSVLDRHAIRDLAAVGDGGVGHLYLRARLPPARAATVLATARRLALATPGIQEALYLAPNPVDGGAAHTLRAMHPDWHLVHERTGDLLLVAAPGYQLVDGSAEESALVGNHGGPGEREVPAIVLGGAPIGRGGDCDDVTAADIGQTILACLGLRDTRRLDGKAIPAEARGRPLSGVCPPVGPSPSPRAVTTP